MVKFDKIVAIYNPISTNGGEQKAMDFKHAAARSGIEVEIIATQYTGHAAKIAKQIVKKYDQPLLISVSGDGGYNELINGVISAKRGTQKQPVVAIIAAGNANDHKRTTRGDKPLLRLIKHSSPKPLDILKLRTGKLDRYAHSYIGFGLTPSAGKELNKFQLNWYKELLVVLRSFKKFKPITLKHGGQTKSYASLIFANIEAMSKILKLGADSSTPRDGKFELIANPWTNKLNLLLHFAKLTAVGKREAPKYKQFTFTTLDNKTLVQLDGEIESIDKNTEVTITAEHGAVLSLY